MIAKVYVIYLLIKHITAQYDPYAYNDYNTLLQVVPANTYQEPAYNNQWNIPQTPIIEQSEDYPNTNEYVTCSCERCTNPKPCCKEFCKRCPPAYDFNPFNYVFMPFSYPFDYLKYKDDDETTEKATITTVMTTETTTTPTTNTTVTTTSTTEDTYKQLRKNREFRIQEDEAEAMYPYNDPFHVKGRNQFMLTSLRRTKPNWIPNYGIVPISDGFAQKLMLQLRSMKVLHPRKNNIRTVDEMTPV